MGNTLTTYHINPTGIKIEPTGIILIPTGIILFQTGIKIGLTGIKISPTNDKDKYIQSNLDKTQRPRILIPFLKGWLLLEIKKGPTLAQEQLFAIFYSINN